jgi:hypothetical protein
LSEPRSRSEGAGEEPVKALRVKLYEQLMEAQEQIAQARYGRGVAPEAVLAAMDAAETEVPEDARREDLYVASLVAYVEALGGRLEIRAVVPDDTVVVTRGVA